MDNLLQHWMEVENHYSIYRYVALCHICHSILSKMQWHPSTSAIISTTNTGNILLWHSPLSERWGAFAGGFEEVDENIEYEEREDEFDVVSSHCICQFIYFVKFYLRCVYQMDGAKTP